MANSNTYSPDFEDETVTVVIPFSEDHTPRSMLEEAVESVETQDGVDAKPIVVEDEDQRGPAWARNVGLERADTRLVAFLDADDLWKPDKLARQLRRMEETGAGMCVEGEPGRSTTAFIRGLLASEIRGLTSTIVVDTDRVDARFDENLPRREDHLYMIEVADSVGVCFVEDLYVERLTDDGLTANVEKSTEQAAAFFERLCECVPEIERFRDLYYQDVYVDVGRYRHEQEKYQEALRCFCRSLSHGPNVKAVGAIGLTMIAATLSNADRLIRGRRG